MQAHKGDAGGGTIGREGGGRARRKAAEGSRNLEGGARLVAGRGHVAAQGRIHEGEGVTRRYK